MMKTFQIIMPLLMLMLVFSCKNEKVDMQHFVAERDSILQDNKSKTQQLDELNDVLSTIAIGLDSIAMQENILFKSCGPDGVRLDKHEIAARLNGMADILARQREKIQILQDSLANRKTSQGVEHLQRVVEFLNQQLAEKDQVIKSLRADLNNSKKDITQLRASLSDMKNRATKAENKTQVLTTALAKQDDVINECYVRIGTKKQTFESLRPNTIEETFELCDALMKRDYKDIKKELGDVLEHVMFYSIIGREDGEFDICDVCNQEADKLMFRHPFINWKEEGNWTVSNPDMYINDEGQVVYRESEEAETGKAGTANAEETLALGAIKPKTATSVEKTWEQIKQQEKDGNERVLSGVPHSLPSLIKAYRIQDKARNVGFDWKEKEDVWDKVQEELEELKVELAKGDKENSTQELGDFIFSVINAARLYKLNPDNALEKTNQKFIRRFNYVEDHSLKQGKNLKDMSLEEMDKLWNEAKLQEKKDDK